MVQGSLLVARRLAALAGAGGVNWKRPHEAAFMNFNVWLYTSRFHGPNGLLAHILGKNRHKPLHGSSSRVVNRMKNQQLKIEI
jgi:hypothetical protein